MNIKLILPSDRESSSLSSAETFKIQKVNLPLLAAYTPPGHTIKIVDESFAPVDVDEDVDLVGITVLTELARRAYHIADTYRLRGVKAVMGGIHATVLPEEALKHADAVVQGEGEEVWPRLVEDASKSRMHQIYRASKVTDVRRRLLSRRDLYPRPASRGYTPFAVGVETSRGCPFDCEFCSVHQITGPTYRVRPIRDVLAEIESIRTTTLFFVDDNLALNRRIAKELFTHMIPLRRRWVGQGTVSLAEDVELLSIMKRSGCEGLLIGFESMHKETQNKMLKITKLNLDYSEAMLRFHGEGIPILGAFLFGFDHETKDVFERTLEFAITQHLDLAQFRYLTPYPGTPLYQRLLDEGRLLVPYWWLKGVTPSTPLFHPKGMTLEELSDGLERIIKEFYSIKEIVSRFLGLSPWRRSATGCRAYVGTNLAMRKRYLRSEETPGKVELP